MKKIIYIASVLILVPTLTMAQGPDELDLRDLMTQREFSKAGLSKLTSDEIDVLNRWLTKYADERQQKTGGESPLHTEQEKKKGKNGLLKLMIGGTKFTAYKIQDVKSDYTFNINNNRFDSTSKCPGYKIGDEVIFTEGRADGACVTAEFSRPDSSDRCEVLCK